MEVMLKDGIIELTDVEMDEIRLNYGCIIVKKNLATGNIFKFSSLTEAEKLWDCTNCLNFGFLCTNLPPHTDKSDWENVPYNKERGLWHGQPVELWDNSMSHMRYVGFYNAVDDEVFNSCGSLSGHRWENIKALPSDRYDDWIFKAYETLEGIK